MRLPLGQIRVWVPPPWAAVLRREPAPIQTLAQCNSTALALHREYERYGSMGLYTDIILASIQTYRFKLPGPLWPIVTYAQTTQPSPHGKPAEDFDLQSSFHLVQDRSDKLMSRAVAAHISRSHLSFRQSA